MRHRLLCHHRRSCCFSPSGGFGCHLNRYGYLPNPANNNGLPIGFTASGPESVAFVGMTCSACHTRQITADGRAYRIDGGPAIVDWQSFSIDLDAAVAQVLHNEADFQAFAAAVLGPGAPQPDDLKALRENLQLWFDRYDAWAGSLPQNTPWGPGRMDAVSMIFNRCVIRFCGMRQNRTGPNGRALLPMAATFLL
jgi:hypothetical protein